MSKSISILDQDYILWIKDLSSRYRRSQIKAAVKVNQEMLQFYWDLGKDIVERDVENRYGARFYASLSRDLKTLLPDATGLSERNLYYTKKFYNLYRQVHDNLQQVVADSDDQISQQLAAKLFSVPWGHHMLLIDKVKDDYKKAWFYVCEIVENGWSRNMLLNGLDTDLYERPDRCRCMSTIMTAMCVKSSRSLPLVFCFVNERTMRWWN